MAIYLGRNNGTLISNVSKNSGLVASSADKVSYDNQNSILAATDVQSAIDEILEYGLPSSGEVLAEDVIFSHSFETSQSVGGIPSGYMINNTTDLYALIRLMLRPTTPPTYTLPSISLTGTSSGNIEIGTNITPTLTPTVTLNDSAGVDEYRLYKSGTVIFTNPTQTAHTDTQFSLLTTTIYSAQIDYQAANIKNDSEGQPDSTGIYGVGTRTSGNVIYTPVRKSFFGSLSTPNVPDDSVSVRALPQNTLNPAQGNTLAAQVSAGSGRVIAWAYPSNLRAAIGLRSDLAGNIPIGNLQYAEISVEGANNASPTMYRVYWVTNASNFGQPDVYTLTI